MYNPSKELNEWLRECQRYLHTFRFLYKHPVQNIFESPENIQGIQ